MIFNTRPADFNPKMEVVSCFVENDGKFLLLHRQDHKPEGNTWGVPAGKVEKDESHLSAILREIEEETGLSFTADQLEYLTKVFVRYPYADIIFHIFRTALHVHDAIVIDPSAHKDYCWATPQESLEMPLIPDEDGCIKLVYDL